MLIRANYRDDKIVALHAQRTDGISNYCQDLAKDPSNGFTKDRSKRRIGSFPVLTLMEYDRVNPGWYMIVSTSTDMQERQTAWRKFLASDYAKPFMMVEKLKH